jgi:hypothetical protein
MVPCPRVWASNVTSSLALLVTQLRAGYAKRGSRLNYLRRPISKRARYFLCPVAMPLAPPHPHVFPPPSKLTLSGQSPSPITVYGVTGIPKLRNCRHGNRPSTARGSFQWSERFHHSFFQGYVSLHVIVAPSKQDTSPIEPSFLSGAAACVQVTRQRTKPRAPRSPK